MNKALFLALILAVSACGAPQAPTAPTETSLSDARIRELEAQLFALANEARAADGKPPLRYDESLASVARAHSRDMVEHAFVSHQSPTTGSPSDRLVRAGTRSSLVLENLAEAEGTYEIHRGWLESPSHRANLLNADVNRIGVGVVPVSRSGRTMLVATQLFARMTDAIDAASAPAAVLDAVNRARLARDAAPLQVDDALAAAAQEAALRFFADAASTEQALLDQASARVRPSAARFRRIGGATTVVTSLEEASDLAAVLDPEVRHVGVGIAQGSRADTPSNAIFVVYMMGWPR